MFNYLQVYGEDRIRQKHTISSACKFDEQRTSLLKEIFPEGGNLVASRLLNIRERKSGQSLMQFALKILTSGDATVFRN
jgi:hypothetical protein